jgi:hypothetical protein
MRGVGVMVKRFVAGRCAIVIAAVFLAAVVPLSLSCGGEEETTGPTPETFTYPHANGAEWVYSYEGESLVKYVISGTYDHPSAGTTQKLISYVFASGGWQKYDTQYLKVTATDVRLYLDQTSSGYYMLLKFPVKVGNQWDAGKGYTATVSTKETASVPAGSFSCYKIDYTSSAWNMTFWWPSKIGGMGAKNYGLWAINGTPITIDLKSYNLPT